MPHEIIRLEKVSRVFFTEELETHALAEVDVAIHTGEFVSVTGPSGCGKSTLLSVLGLLDPPTSGRFLLEGEDVCALPASQLSKLRNRKIGFVFQSFNLIGDMSVLDNVLLPLTFRDDLGRQERTALAQSALQRVEMDHRMKHLPAQLSGGQQQRVAIARALAGSPGLILADEPTGNLDSKNGEMVMQLLRRLNDAGSTICMVTHDLEQAAQSHRQIHMLDGKVVESEVSHEVQRRA
ncbi:ABC transporter ATP-binding protein [Xanthomonas fragariae]|uniref:ABC transporter ATP-binding protein n=1 Tax=Xanthomonas fragariae TaxID=48664 RepID=UPI0022AB4703|nr:ABC transporter ATP-binding protein [Xanthomonas fragariae]WAT14869.1 ABC transporter ATP-binding protein [Xanthomonas fragariae]